MSEDRADQERVKLVEAAFQRLAQLRELGAHPTLRHLREHRRVSRARAQRVEHRASGLAEDVGSDAVQLDPAVLQRLVQAVGLTLALGDLRLAITSELAQLTDRLGRNEAGTQQAGLGQSAQPLGIRDVGLAPRDLFDMTRVDQQQLEVVFEHMPHRLPIHARRFHRDLRDAMRRQPIAKGQKPPNRCLELREMLHPLAVLAGYSRTRGDLRLVHVQRSRTLNNHIHQNLPSDDDIDRRPPGASKTDESEVRAQGTVPGSGGGPHAKLNSGSQAPQRAGRQAGGIPILAQRREDPRSTTRPLTTIFTRPG